MVFKINISTKEGKTFHLESESQGLIGKELNGNVSGNEVSPDLQGYEFQITGTSDKAGFSSLEQIEGTGLGKALLSYEKGMKKRPKREGKWKRSKNRPKGLRLRKTARGKVISEDIIQINLKTLKEGAKKLSQSKIRYPLKRAKNLSQQKLQKKSQSRKKRKNLLKKKKKKKLLLLKNDK
jgi:small subunit ribosomal protein S6e